MLLLPLFLAGPGTWHAWVSSNYNNTGEQGAPLLWGAVGCLTMLLIQMHQGSSTKISGLQAFTPLCKAREEPICIVQHLLTFKAPAGSVLPRAEGHHPARAVGHKFNPQAQAWVQLSLQSKSMWGDLVIYRQCCPDSQDSHIIYH